MKSLKWKK